MILARAKALTWNSDRSFKPAYFAGNDVLEVAHEGYKMYIDENALYGKTSYPSLHRYETEVIEMLVDLLNGPTNSGGSLTSGGTESNIVAMNTAREWAKEHKPEIISPEIPRLLKDYGFKSNSCWYLFMVVLISLDVILILLFVTPPMLSRKCCKRLL